MEWPSSRIHQDLTLFNSRVPAQENASSLARSQRRPIKGAPSKLVRAGHKMEPTHTFCAFGAGELRMNLMCRNVSTFLDIGFIQGVGISPQCLVLGLHCCGVIHRYVWP